MTEGKGTMRFLRSNKELVGCILLVIGSVWGGSEYLQSQTYAIEDNSAHIERVEACYDSIMKKLEKMDATVTQILLDIEEMQTIIEERNKDAKADSNDTDGIDGTDGLVLHPYGRGTENSN